MRILLPLLVLPAAVVAQQAPVVALVKPTIEFPAELSSISGVRELQNGNLVVLDRKEKRVVLIDGRSGEAKQIGRDGEGPGEYRRPVGLVALPADTTLIEDSGNSRFLVIDASGKPVATLPPVRIKPQENVTYGLSPRGTDVRGRFYLLLPTGLAPDSLIPIIRFDRTRQAFDTVARVINDRFKVQPGKPLGRSGGTSFGVIAPKPFAQRDEWVVFEDGAIAVAHGSPYAVDWTIGGTTTAGRPLPFVPVKVTAAERQLWMSQLREAGAPTITTRSADGKTEVQQLPIAEPEEWPETMPAFYGQAALAGPNGAIWIMRASPASAKVVTYDVIDRRGVVTRQVTLPPHHRVVAFGRDAVYVARQDDDGLLHLQRHAWK